MSTSITSENPNDARAQNGEGSTGREAVRPLPVGREARAGIKVLIVDDEHTLREGCANVLQGEGYDVTTSGRGQEALDLVRRRPFDIVLVDLYMSQVSGMELMKAALASEPRRDRHRDDGEPESRIEHRGPAPRRVGLPPEAVLRERTSRS